jgi:hypothetical protein
LTAPAESGTATGADYAPVPLRKRVIDALSLGAVVLSTVWLARAAGLRASPWVVAGLVMGGLLAMPVAILLHELGHLAAGWLAGFGWELIKLGPLLLRHGEHDTSWQWGRHHAVRGMGLVVPAPRKPDRTREHAAVMLLGGPAASLAVGIGALRLFGWMALPLALRMGSGLVGACSLVVLFTSLAPYTSSGHLSDGGKLFGLWRRG